jgi:hypothetical protein
MYVTGGAWGPGRRIESRISGARLPVIVVLAETSVKVRARIYRP